MRCYLKIQSASDAKIIVKTATHQQFHQDRLRLFQELDQKFSSEDALGLNEAARIGIVQCVLHRLPADAFIAESGTDFTPPRQGFMTLPESLLACLAGWGFCLLVTLKRRGQPKPMTGSAEVSVSLPRRHNGNKHLLHYLEQVPSDQQRLFVNIDTGFFRGPEADLPESIRSKVHLVSPYSLGSLLAATRNSPAIWRQIHRLGIEMKTCLRLSRKDRLHRLFHLSRNLCRGLMLRHFFATSGIIAEAETVIFGNLNTDCISADHYLRNRGIKTIHWLHGTVEDELKYFGFSSVCLTENKPDAAVRQGYGAYGQVVRAPGATRSPEPARLTAAEGPIFLFTNLLHHGHQLPLAMREASMKKLFATLADSAGGRRQIVWFPHPAEELVGSFADFVESARRQGMSVERAGSWQDRLREEPGLAVTTFSGMVCETAKLGRAPVVWDDVRYPNVGLWKAIPADLCFRDEESLQDAFAHAQTLESQTDRWGEFVEALDISESIPPKPDYFTDLDADKKG